MMVVSKVTQDLREHRILQADHIIWLWKQSCHHKKLHSVSQATKSNLYIYIVCKHLLKRTQESESIGHKLVITEAEPVLKEVHAGTTSSRHDLKTTHEEADVFIVQQAIALANTGSKSLRILCDDTDVFVLLLHFYLILCLTCKITKGGNNPTKNSSWHRQDCGNT